jgi:hypothetical protein
MTGPLGPAPRMRFSVGVRPADSGGHGDLLAPHNAQSTAAVPIIVDTAARTVLYWADTKQTSEPVRPRATGRSAR